MTPLVTMLIEAGIKFGPDFVMKIIAVIKNPDATVADVEALFANVKPYSAYGIPDVIPPAK